jgi:sugar O-acyltransferase (sialic acid O-acetyltransferase NeuD family)
MNRLIIIGAGGFGREVLAWARSHPDHGKRWTIGGFLDDNLAALNGREVGVPVIARLKDYEPERADVFLCAIGAPAARFEAHAIIRGRGGRFITLVHPLALVAERVYLGQGVIVGPFAIVSVDCQIGDGCALCHHSSLAQGAVLGSCCQISAHCDIAGDVTLGSGVFLGSHAVVLPGVKVSDRAVVGAGMVVVRDIAVGVASENVDNRSLIRQRLLIVGAGDFGREVFCWASQVIADQRDWEFEGFLDESPDALNGLNLGARILGAPSTHNFEDRDRVVVAIGAPAQRRNVVEILKKRGARFTTLIHPSVTMGLNNSWGVGCIFCPGVILTTNVKIGNHVIFNCHSSAGHDAVIGSFCTLSPSVDITGYATLGEGVLLGSNASILPYARVGDGAVIGACSAVLKKVQPRSTVMGVPAREVWKVPDSDGSKP